MNRFVKLVSGLALVCTMAFAGEHSLTSIKGTDIDLKTYDHAIAGSIRDFVVFGDVNEAEGSSTLMMKRDGQLVQAKFSRIASGLGGVIEHQTDEKTLKTEIQVVGVDKANQVLKLMINGSPIDLQIKADKFEKNHFFNPEYSAVINGKKIIYKFENGQACYNYSAHLAMLILGASIH